MRTLRNKTKVSTIAFVVILTIGALMAGIPVVNAVEVDTYAFLAVFPNPVGVGQNVVVTFWVEPLQPTAYDFFHNFTVTITKPDGTPQTFGPYTSSAMGGSWFNYVPDAAGTYKLQFSYPGETFTSTGDYYKPVTSRESELIVQQEPIPEWPPAELPTDYWERPISAENREWWQIAGNWLMDGYNATTGFIYNSGAGFNPYSQAPRTAHIAWTKELGLGGLVGGEYGTTSYYTWNDYEARLTPPIIMNGRLYYRIYESDFRTGIRPGFVCVDLRTGEELWRNTEGNIDVGQLYDYRSGNQMGATPFLWDIGANALFGELHMPHTWKIYDPFTGDLILSFENALQTTTQSVVFGNDGTMFVYFLDNYNNWLAMWNSTKALVANGLIYFSGAGEGFLRPSQPYGFFPNLQGTYDWKTGIQWNITTPDLPDYPDLEYGGILSQSIESIMGDVLFVTVEDFAHSYLELAYDRNTGQRKWIHNTTQWTWSRAFGEGVYADFHSPSMTWFGFDVKTGNQLWQSDPQEYPWGLYNGGNVIIADGKLIVMSYDGYVHAYNITNGKQVWKHYSEDTAETPYGHYPFYYGPITAGGVVFAGTGEHSPTQPIIRGLKLHAIDAETGEGIWNITGLLAPQAIADGYLVTLNGYDNRIYVFGKSKSVTTVSASQTTVAKGSTVLIQGTVTDQSPAQPGTPCVSKESMSAWMEYLHMQKECPMATTGVPVKLEAFGADGSYIDIGTVTSDVNGFRYEWTPPDEGLYTILATFNGDESYGVSWGATGLSVGPALEAPVTPAVQEDIDQAVDSLIPILYGTIVAVAVAIGIGIVNLWALRKRT